MEQWYPIVIGSVIFSYIHMFIWNMKRIGESNGTNYGESGDRTRAL